MKCHVFFTHRVELETPGSLGPKSEKARDQPKNIH